jgi:trimeric autotransporter adhesin
VITQQIDSSNMGKRFWVAYAKSWDFTNGNYQDMVLYLSAGSEPATVTVKVNGTTWVKTYNIPANTVITTDKMPKAGFYDSRLMNEGKYSTGISVESDAPIVAYAHIYYNTNSGATMLLPVGTYGYEYYTLSAKQHYGSADTHSSFFVVADRDSTMVEITPSNPTHGGRPAGVPFRVTLNRGEVYQVLGAYISGNDGYDLTGSRVVSVPNANGKCYPIAVFAGSSRTRLGCGGSTSGGGDLLFQQVFPSQAWGTRYLTAPTSIAATASSFQTNIYRVMVKDPATQVKLNGTVLTNLVAGRFYEFESITADYIEANKPVMVAQYMGSSNSACAGSTSNYDGDPEMFYLSPLEQAIKKTGFYRNNVYSIPVNYLTLTIPTNGLSSLTIDGSGVFDYTYVHPNLPGYSVVVKRWGNASGQSWVQSDSAFTGIVYGEGYLESYGYNVGTMVKNLNALHSITNTLSTMGGASEYTCTNAPFKVSILVPVKPTTLTWNFSQVPGLAPNANVTLISPVAVDSIVINNKKYYKYIVSQEYKFSKTGTYNIPVSYTHPEIEGCNNTLETLLTVKVVQAPLSDFAVDFTNCIGDVAKFSGSGGTGVTVTQWTWNLGDGSTATIQNPSRQYAAPGTYDVNLKLVTQDGCLGDTTRKIPVNDRPLVDVVKDTLIACSGSSVTFNVKGPETGVTYDWYNAATGGTKVGTGTSYTATVTGTANYYVEAMSSGCASTSRKKVTALLLPNLAQPVVVVDSASNNAVRFKWSAVPGATGYEVSTDNGATWVVPSSGATGQTHLVTGLLPLQPVTLIVRAKGGCQDVQSLAVTGKALIDQVFIPNSFSPNGDGLNDVLQVYGYVVKEMQFMVFNQWGQKIHESRDQKRAWDGTHKGKQQPSGVYLYVCKLILNDGSVITKKGSINLVR